MIHLTKFDEKSLVEDYFIEKLESIGWSYYRADELERESFDEPLLTPILTRSLQLINEDIGIGDEEIKEAMNELKLSASGFEGVGRILNYLKYGIPVKFTEDKLIKYVRLIDFENQGNNQFNISRQITHRKGRDEIRNDIILYVNGIPLVNIECKNPLVISEDWYAAFCQIKDYEKTVPELYKYIQIGVAAEDISMYFPIVPWMKEIHIHEWKEKGKDSIDSTIEMLRPKNLLNIIRNYLFLRIEYGHATKVITRYIQHRASEKIYNRIIDNLKDKTKKNKGLIWHWQGSGKTLTMIFAANKIYQTKELENPSIFFIVDRDDLQEQLRNEFNALDITKAEVIDSIQTLKEVIRHDEGRGKRGLFIVLIHKFRPDELQELQKELEQISKTKETILTRRNVVGFIDEGDRTQYGILAGQMKQLLRNAFFFSFTGTPISDKERDTYRDFAYPPDEYFLDKYFITDSIKDNFTVKIAYQPRLEEIPGIQLNRDMLDTFISTELEEIPENYREKVEKKVKQQLNRIQVVLENEKRIKKIAEDIAVHFKENIDGTFKAMVVGVSRKACVHYKRALDEFLPKEYSEVIMTYNTDDDSLIKDYEQELRLRHKGKDMEDIRKELIEEFKEGEYPRIIIVTDMLLRGFDAPILQVLYLDKLLKGSRLLQAIARTNRPYKNIKEAGMIIDYVGILREVRKAFQEYNKEDISGVLYNIKDLKQEFIEVIDETMNFFDEVPKDTFDRQTMNKALEILTTNEEQSKIFLNNYRRLRMLFELLGPDEIKIRLLSEYKWLSAIHTSYIRKVQGQDRGIERVYIQKFFKKTLKYVHESTEVQEIDRDLKVIEFDEHYLQHLEEQVESNDERAANIVFTLNRFILVEKHKNPVFETLTDKVERILELWKKKIKDYRKIYEEGTEIVVAANKLTARQKSLKFSNLEYSILLTLEKKFAGVPQLIQDTKELSLLIEKHMFSGWMLQKTARKNIEGDVRRFLRRYIKEFGIGMQELDELYQKIMDNVMNYGD